MNVLFKEYTEEDYKKTGFNDGYSDGFDDGVNQGVLKAKREDATAMIQDGFSNDKVQKYSGLSINDINKLRKELKL